MEIGIVPVNPDSVLVGTMQRTRVGRVKALLVLGSNEGLLPLQKTDEGLLSEREKAVLEEMDLEFVLYDPIIRENNCLFMLKGNEEHLVVRTRTAHTGKDDAVQKISIDALTSIVFGYKELEKIEEEEKEIFSAEFKEEISKLMPFSPVFINEIV